MYKKLISVCLLMRLFNAFIFADDFDDGMKALKVGDSAQALQSFMSASDKGNVKAQTKIAYMYVYGSKDFPKDKIEAIKWFKKAADNGEVEAQFIIAEVYRNGQGVKQDYREAINYYQKAAEQGNLQSAKYLANMFYIGEGVNKNSKISYALFIIASANGSSNAIRDSQKAASFLNNEELIEAKELANNPEKLWQLINIAKKEEIKRVQLEFGEKFNVTQSSVIIPGKLKIPKMEYIHINFEPEGCMKMIKIYDKDNYIWLSHKSSGWKSKKSFDKRKSYLENIKHGFKQGEYYIDLTSATDACEVVISEGQAY